MRAATDRKRQARAYSALVLALAVRAYRIRYRQSLLRSAWLILTPIGILLVYGTVLTQSFDVSASCSSYLASAWVGLVVWTFFAAATGDGSGSILVAGDLLSRVAFPRLAIPISIVVVSLLDLVIGFALLVPILAVEGTPLTANLLLAPLPILVVVLWATSIGVLAAVLAPFSRDVTQGIALALRVGFVLTPVMYEAAFLPSAVAWTAEANPIASAIGALRAIALCGELPSTGLLLGHAAVAGAVLVGVLAYARGIENRLIDAM